MVLTISGASRDVMLLDRLIETAPGAVLGTLINTLVLPPTYERRAREATAELHAVLLPVRLALDALTR
ncbi:hypothetical protein [Actinokineospora sp. NBRC 105648]|uniref:hypothetical protein n=1 Tax=Actinokineospora sp. NBRC 105648 TaxID=3032206 RepID=UPI00249FBD5D|nr:hypothetical protein [Actinokineospora sp. NBRC 105648]GLZ36719.1 hypothetical protein Acsp05_03440 [Actinokineospora sp. NBRC 105648]